MPPTTTLVEFIPVLILAFVVMGVAAGMVITPYILGKRRSTGGMKDTPYECGMPADDPTTGTRFGVKFYVVAMLFILFDIEVVFLAGWAWIFRDLQATPGPNASAGQIALAVFFFLAILEIAHLYAWRRGAFDWAPSRDGGKPPPPSYKVES